PVRLLGGLLVDEPEDNRCTAFAAAHVPASILGLLEGKPVGCAEALCDQEEDIDTPVGPAAHEIDRKAGAVAGPPALLPGDDSLLQQGEDAIGDELVDLLTHGQGLRTSRFRVEGGKPARAPK